MISYSSAAELTPDIGIGSELASLLVMCMGTYIVDTSCMTYFRTSSRDVVAFNAVTCQHIKSRLDRRACVKGCAKHACFSGQAKIQDLHVRRELLHIIQLAPCGVEDVDFALCKPGATIVYAIPISLAAQCNVLRQGWSCLV